MNCCLIPCITVEWVKKAYGYFCLNCKGFTPCR